VRPELEIGRIECGVSLCSVDVSVWGPGASSIAGVALQVRRRRSRRGPEVNRINFARRRASTRWRARSRLPFGRLSLYARAFDEDGNLLGRGKRVTVLIERG